ncbi:MAG: hypothetical protein U0168_01855 [Nannocystaceae bacterium]
MSELEATAETSATPSSATPSPCGRCASPLEPGDLRCAICGLPTPPSPRGDAVAEVVATIFRCSGCGAAVRYDEKAAAPKCSFCGEVLALEKPTDPIEEANAYLRFRVDAEQAKVALRRWLGTLGFFRPKDLQGTAVVDKLQPLWWAGWCFDAEVTVSWAADSDAGSRRSAWAPHAGAFELALDNVVVSASRGLSDRECAALVPGYNLRDADTAPDPGHHGAVEGFDVQRSAARATISRALSATAARHAQSRVPGSSVRNLRVAVVPRRLTTSRLGFPAYVLAYRYGDTVYRAIVHGQNPGIVHGSAPLSWLRIVMVVAGAIAAIGVVAVIVWLATRR